MKPTEILSLYKSSAQVIKLSEALFNSESKRIRISGLCGSSISFISAALMNENKKCFVFILSDKEEAAYFFNDLENLFEEHEKNFEEKNVLFYPTSYKKPYEIEKTDNSNILLRTEVLNRINNNSRPLSIVTYPEALSEKVVTKSYITTNTFKISVNDNIDLDFLIDLLIEYDFERTEFVTEPGQFTIRGGLVDVFSFSNEHPSRIEFGGDKVESIRTFDTSTQLSIHRLNSISLLPNVQNRLLNEKRDGFINFLSDDSIICIEDFSFTREKIDIEFEKVQNAYEGLNETIKLLKPEDLFIEGKLFASKILDFKTVEFGKQSFLKNEVKISFNTFPQPTFNKNVDLLIQNLFSNTEDGFLNIIFADKQKQIERIHTIFEDIVKNRNLNKVIEYTPIHLSIHEGFVDRDLKTAFYTDHQIFERYHRFKLKENFVNKEALTLKEFSDLKPGDFITHINHGIGRFSGLEKIEINGSLREAIRLIFKDDSILHISIHSLHKISKYSAKDGAQPTLNRLGSQTWTNLKNKTKQRVKDIAKDLIQLYAERRTKEGFSFSPDTYLQHELEASFIYEDTPDQVKATADVKKDMEKDYPMDRLVCGDVGFGKTEVAIRAAFKSVSDSKQVAVLVPTTILALQHFKTFSERLKDFPCTVDYLNRFKTAKEIKSTLEKVQDGKVDILIGTHRLLSKDVKFKDLGLLILDEEQKFGVAAKEKLKQFKVNVDSLTLTATPIPRTLQFSLMGARDLSIINTPPQNRYPVNTEMHVFNEEKIRDAITYEVTRGGQVFYVHNRVQNIQDVAGMIQRICPNIRVAIGHGQMDGTQLENVMLDFIDGEYDVLVATTIIESGLDIPNANTIIISDAQNYGLSDLHQLRGRVGRTNKKAFCYLLAPPLSILTDEARKRLKAIEEFSDLGSGFNIAMRDLDIRGAGNLLGAEQSGFIADIGYEMYQKILDEAILELKETDFKELYKDEIPKDFVRDCLIETDLEILIPDEYLSNITERLSLYKELDNLNNEEELFAFQEKLIDRFGPLPKPTQELINTIRLRWIAKSIGFEKLVLKNSNMLGYFISNQDSPYYQSDSFSYILKFIQENPYYCRMKEGNNKLTLSFENVRNILTAIEKLKRLNN